MSLKQNESNGCPKPFVKWAGGKNALVVEFEKKGLIPKHFNNYFEPFIGGGAVFFYLFNNNYIKNKSYLIDINKELINTYNCIKKRHTILIDQLKILNEMISSTDYYILRDEFNSLKIKNKLSIAEKNRKAALFIYLNKTCYNGLYRENKSGEFNVPFGDYKNPKILDEYNLNCVSSALKNSNIYSHDFNHCIRYAKKGDFVYFDPPYLPLSKTANFTSYSKNNFNMDDQLRLVETFSQLTDKNVLVLLSNSYHEDIKNIYDKIDGVKFSKVFAPRYISCKGNDRKPILEYAITNFSPAHRQTHFTSE